jgi:hypothetical protein
MKVLLLMLAHLLTTLAKLLGPGGARTIVADSLLMKQQLLIINRSRRRAPKLTPIDRMLPGLWTLPSTPHSASGSHSQTLDALELLRHAQEVQVSTAILV